MSEPSKPRARPLVSAVLQDGSIVESIFRPDVHQTAFLQARDGEIKAFNALNLPRLGQVVPYSPNNNLLTHNVVLLPSAATDYESVVTLVSEVRAFIHKYADVSEGFEEVASYYILLTWIYDAFSEVPYLRLRGDFGSGKSRCLLTIGSLCYKPMFASGASTVSPLFRILDAFRGTLVLDESDFRFSDEKSEIIKILNNGNAAGFPVLRSEVTPQKEFNPTAFCVFGPKIIATRGAFDDRALESRCITEVMTGLAPRADIPLNLPKEFHEESRSLRNLLLMYRFKNRARDHDLGMARNIRGEARVAQMFAPLLSIVEDVEARQRILKLAEGSAQRLATERSATIEAQLLDIIYQMRGATAVLGIKDIAARFTEQFGSEYRRLITPRWIGAQLRSRLSILPVKSHGNFVIPPTEDSKLQLNRPGFIGDRFM